MALDDKTVKVVLDERHRFTLRAGLPQWNRPCAHWFFRMRNRGGMMEPRFSSASDLSADRVKSIRR
jgi:hypothetical protein